VELAALAAGLALVAAGQPFAGLGAAKDAPASLGSRPLGGKPRHLAGYRLRDMVVHVE
jgi:hypothetical protein